ncbi:MAG: SulP family inorganic anion transporter [Acidimicrobiales bacterium]|nr:SulP family inorganic anion transporter [Acidimicrobiales bacterium]HRW38030.1 SulP family inorganic anion transporter [Aquihabitans sp.]
MSAVAPTRPRLPIVGWARSYERPWLRTDLLAGFTLWGLLVPEMIAYAGLAGLPPQAGLYTLLASLVAYAVLGTSRQLVVAGTSASAVLVYAAVHELHPGDAGEAATLAAAVIVLTGLVFLVAGAAKLGFLASFLSRPVMTGFVFGLALFVAVRQLPKVLGIEGGEGNSVEQLAHVLRHLGDLDPATLVVGLGALALLFVLGERAPRVPAGLVVLVAAIGTSTLLDLEGRGVAVVGAIPGGLPSPSLPRASLADLWILLPSAIGMMLVIYSEALGAAAAFAEAHGDRIDPDQELVALGVANVGSGLLGGLAAGGSLSQSAVNDGAGARSQVSTLFASGLALITIIALTGLFEQLPEAVLGALILHAVAHLMKVGELRRIARLSRAEFGLAAATLVAVLVLDVLPALILGVVVSIVLVIGRASRPAVSVLGVDPDHPAAYLDHRRHPTATPVPGLHLVRPDAPIFYANAQAICDAITEATGAADPPVATVVLDLDGSDALDITSTEHLVTTARALDRAGIALALANVHAPARRTADALGLTDAVGADRIHPTVHDAVLAHRRTEAP